MTEEEHDGCYTNDVPTDGAEEVWWAVCESIGVWRIHAPNFDRIGYLVYHDEITGVGNDFWEACEAVAIHLALDDPKASLAFQKLYDFFKAGDGS